jgi:hypothetical protein
MMPKTTTPNEPFLSRDIVPPTYEALLIQNKELIAQNSVLLEQVHQLGETVQKLRDEIARLKKQNGKPHIGPSKMTGKKKRGKKRKRARKPRRRIDETVVVKAKDVPPLSEFKGYSDFVVQELVIKNVTTRYRLEKWLTPDGKVVTGKLDLVNGAPHFGPTLCSFVLYQYYHAQVTEPLILEQLGEWGVQISKGELHRMITEGKEKFHKEKAEILRVGLRVSGHVNVDDTGARHQGQNGYCTHIGNKWFAWFASTSSKSRVNFFKLLCTGRIEYVISEEALAYMATQRLAKKSLKLFSSEKGRIFTDEAKWQTFLRECEITVARQVRVATEGALLGCVLRRDINPELVVVSDEAPQFEVLLHALCWIHAERNLAKLIGFNEAQRRDLEKIRKGVWKLYRDIQAYQKKPTDKVKRELEQRFDNLCQTETCFTSLNLALKRIKQNKRELLLVLERPDLPLHNNMSETDIREYVKRRKISGGTRSENGRNGRDTFASLKKTCRKLGVSFWEYLTDRICDTHRIPSLPALIEAKAGET